MNLTKELERIEEIGSTAWSLVEDGRYRQARTVIKKIRGSYCVSESDRMITLVEAKICERKGERLAGKKLILENIYSVWNCREAFEIMATAHAQVDANTGQYYIEVLGGLARLGIFTQFSENHIGSFDVLANSVDEAMQYIDEICHFDDPTAKLVLTCARNERQPDSCLHRGVMRAYPFRLYREEVS